MSYNERLEDRIDHLFIDNEQLEKKNQMGGVGWLVNGNMCFGIYEDLLIIRLEESLAHSLIGRKGIDLFKQNQDELKGFISLGSTIYNSNKAFRKFLLHSYEYTKSLPPNEHDEDSNGFSDVSL